MEVVLLTGYPRLVDRPLQDAAQNTGVTLRLINPWKEEIPDFSVGDPYLVIDSRVMMKAAFRTEHSGWLRDKRFSLLGWAFDDYYFPEYQVEHYFRESKLMPRAMSESSCSRRAR